MGIRENFKKGSVEMIILRLLSEKDMYGYEMTQKISEWSDNVIHIPEGSLYPTLYRLLDHGFVSDRRELVGRRQSRIYYHLEPAGSARLQEMLAEYEIFSHGLTSIFMHQTEPANENADTAQDLPDSPFSS